MSETRALSNADLRELVATVEFLRICCEHSEGRTDADQARLSKGMRLAMRVARKYGERLDDYERVSFWNEVRDLAGKFGVEEERRDG
ncbi:MAG TPA: hypothetical protein PLA50_00870 [Bacteroidia bacterium]|nr:hypothetical protein [Bacteroidia bacterium]